MESFVSAVNNAIWSPALVILLVAAGLYFSIRTRFVQARKFRQTYRLMFKKGDKDRKGVSAFESFCITLSGRVGTGNIVGVATAIAIGGPGAIFWMWLSAFFGTATAFVESTLAQIYKFPYKGAFRGGPSSYIDKGLNARWLAVIFAVVTIFSSGFCLTTVQSNGYATAAENAFGFNPLISGIVLAVIVGLVVFGGQRRIAKVESVIAPLMSVSYLVVALIVVAVNWRAIPGLLSDIVTSAFGINPLCGGIMGATITMGVKRGLFSNEAGQGTGAIPSASAEVEHPAEQGLVQIFSVFADTFIVCTATALMILSAGTFNIVDPASGEILVENAPELGANYVGFTQAAVDSVFGGFGSSFVCVALAFFVFSTLPAYYLYAESSILYLCTLGKGENPVLEKVLTRLLQALLLIATVFGASREANIAWALGDIGVGLMAWINVIAILFLAPKAINALKDYEKSK